MLALGLGCIMGCYAMLVIMHLVDDHGTSQTRLKRAISIGLGAIIGFLFFIVVDGL
jgi:hypothetical protein